MNELLVWWYLWVNSNYDVLIMTITLLVVGGLVLEVIRLNKKVKEIEERADWNVQDLCGKFYHLEDLFDNNREDQREVNVNFGQDIAVLQRKFKEITTKRKLVRK